MHVLSSSRPALVLYALLTAGCAASEDKSSSESAPEAGDTGSTMKDTAQPGGDEEDAPSFVADADDGQSVEAVEPERYLGVWYEIASTPSPQQASCAGTTAEYSLRDDGDVRVLNRCYLGDLDGTLNEIEGSASFVDDSYARLLVDFGFGFEAPYNIVELDGQDGSEPYSFAVVSSPGFALWVLSRTPQMDDELYATLVERALDRGLPAEGLIETLQPE